MLSCIHDLCIHGLVLYSDVFLYIGTTGRPKGVTISHSALIVQSLAKIAIVGYTEDDVCLLVQLVYLISKVKSIRCMNRLQLQVSTIVEHEQHSSF